MHADTDDPSRERVRPRKPRPEDFGGKPSRVSRRPKKGWRRPPRKGR